MRPAHTLLFLLAVLAVLAVLGRAMPTDGVPLAGGATLRFPDPADVLAPAAKQRVDISAILALPTDEEGVDTLVPAIVAADTAAVPSAGAGQAIAAFHPDEAPALEDRIALHFPDQGAMALKTFYAALAGAAHAPRPIRVMHYGDSQLEGDRITSYLRNKLQSRFGGHGPGLVSVADIVPHFSVERIISPGWRRYSVMGRRPDDLDHDRFGAISSFSRFTPVLPDSVAPDTTVTHTATITLRPMKRSYARARTWDRVRMFHGWHRAPITVTAERNGVHVRTDTIPPGDRLHVTEWAFGGPSEEVTITISGADSPDVFGLSLEGATGVNVDNIAARGGAGYEFRRTDQALSAAMYAHLDVKLLVLQYGGNVLPNIKDTVEAARYGRFFGGQIARFKRMLPGVGIVVIGPSDMSIKEGDAYVTRPYLEEVRDAMKENALKHGAAFWDMYAAMGGRGSMVSWVEADPPLAATDYTHFTPAGSKKVGELFHTALLNGYAMYLQHNDAAAKQP
ncbi:MAG: GDSL-type esterase/lipase family protein [Flavobacteriales bacterium]|jgi:lysophospholipase L1-like esterase|nr:GDSL-type esterase/lipase family protein [Flavobacteriales bacterium]